MTESDGFNVGVDFPRILDTIASRIYDNQFAFLRENVQNAVDAVRIQANRDGQPVSPGYRVDISVTGNRCEIRDTGNGMTKEELKTHFWTMGASGKNSEEARRAGCIGTFGIGGFANFGVCQRLTVISRTERCVVAHETSLARADFETGLGQLPKVAYQESSELSGHGTIVIGESDSEFDSEGLLSYIKQFVANVQEPVYFDGHLISRKKKNALGDNYKAVTEELVGTAGSITFRYRLYRDEGAGLAVELLGASELESEIDLSGFARLENGSVRVFKRGFKLCEVSVNSRIGVSGSFDSDMAKPTAGRDTLSVESLAAITEVFRCIETKARKEIVLDEELLAGHIRLLPDILASGDLTKLDLLRVRALDGTSHLLSEVREKSADNRVFYSLSASVTPAAEVLQAKGDLIVSIATDRTRRQAEIRYLNELCGAEVFDDLIERLEPYADLGSFERAILAELEIAIKKLFKPEPFLFLPGRLTLDVPIFWSNKKEGDKTIVYIDTKHGEFEKLRPLGYTPLLWSMIEAFSREYLGDTLRKRSTKFFGDGAINLEAYAKSHAELWELVPSEIETSLLDIPEQNQQRVPRTGGQVEIVRQQDITQVNVAEDGNQQDFLADGGQTDDAAVPGKLLEIVDKSGSTGLGGFYIRIPVSASQAFGEIIRTFSNFAILWFANRITWSGSDNLETAFLYHVTLDRLMSSATEPHGAIDLDTTRLQYFKGQIYFYIPPDFHQYLVPSKDTETIKVSVTHELVDLGRSRAWTSREPLVD